MTELYKPSSGTEGEGFMTKFCYRCIHDDEENENYCEIIANAMCFNPDDPEYPKEWTYDTDGIPFCTKFVKDTGEPKEEQERKQYFSKDPNQQNLFGESNEKP